MNIEHVIVTSPSGIAIIIPPVGIDESFKLECVDSLTWTLANNTKTFRLIGQKPDISSVRHVIICEKQDSYERYYEILVKPSDFKVGSFSL